MNLKKLLRKIAFRRRHREKAGVFDTHHYSDIGVVKMHQVLINEWERIFPVCTNVAEQYSYWSWMLGNPGEPFSFRDCLIADGYTRPDIVIDALDNLLPDWFKPMQNLTQPEQVEYLKQFIDENGYEVPAVFKGEDPLAFQAMVLQAKHCSQEWLRTIQSITLDFVEQSINVADNGHDAPAACVAA